MPSQARAEMMPSVDSGRLRDWSVSSMRRTKVAPCRRAKAQLYKAERAPPTWNMPVCEGAKRTLLTCDHPVSESSDSIDADAHLVAHGHRADPGGRPGQDDVAGQQGHHRAHELDERGNVVDELRGARALLDLAVERRGDRDVGRVELGLDPRAERAERVEPLGPAPLIVLRLQVAGGHVVGAGVSEDHLGGAVPWHLTAEPPDHDGELALVVDPFRELLRV